MTERDSGAVIMSPVLPLLATPPGLSGNDDSRTAVDDTSLSRSMPSKTSRAPPRLTLKRSLRGELLECWPGWSSPARKKLKSSPHASPRWRPALAEEALHTWSFLSAQWQRRVPVSPDRDSTPQDEHQAHGGLPESGTPLPVDIRPPWKVILDEESIPSSPERVYSTTIRGADPFPTAGHTSLLLDQLAAAGDGEGSVLQLLVLTPAGERPRTRWKSRVLAACARVKPPYFILLMGLAQVSLHVLPDMASLYTWDSSRLSRQPWRLFSYAMLHSSWTHLALNLGVQTLLAAPLESEQGHLRVGAVYLGGVLAGSLGTAVLSPPLLLVGASAGVYAVLTSHLSHILLNAHLVRHRNIRTMSVLVLSGADVLYTVHHSLRGGNSPRIGVVAHLAGALCGIFLGMVFYCSTRVSPGGPDHPVTCVPPTVLKAARVSSACLLTMAGVASLAWAYKHPPHKVDMETPRPMLTHRVSPVTDQP